MNITKLVELLTDDFYNFSYWSKYGKTRLYFYHTSYVDTFLELEIKNNLITLSIPKCFYTGKTPSGTKWMLNYTLKAQKFINDISVYVNSLL